jgi:hypothetical protein
MVYGHLEWSKKKAYYHGIIQPKRLTLAMTQRWACSYILETMVMGMVEVF